MTSSVEQRVVDLLADGQVRSSGEIAAALSGDAGFTVARDAARDVARVLPGLVAQEYLRRLVYGPDPSTPVRDDRSWRVKFVASDAVLPVCLACWHGRWPDEPPPQMSGNPTYLCALCGGRTNNGAFALRGEVEERRGK